MTEKHTEFLKNEEWLRHKYHVEDRTQSEIAEMVGCSTMNVSEHMARRGISTRVDKSPQERLWDKVDISEPDECWEWKPVIRESSRPGIKVDGEFQSATRMVYKWEVENPGDRRVNRMCDTSQCVNPNHLQLGREKSEVRALGELHGRSKLTREEVEELKKKLAVGNYTQTELAEEYGVSRMQVSNIKRGVNWSHV